MPKHGESGELGAWLVDRRAATQLRRPDPDAEVMALVTHRDGTVIALPLVDDGSIADNCLLATIAEQRDSAGDGFGHRCDADCDDDRLVNKRD
ncbi:MAG: hypothetical protein AAGA68_17675 [Pseudomonadota bacterium]